MEVARFEWRYIERTPIPEQICPLVPLGQGVINGATSRHCCSKHHLPVPHLIPSSTRPGLTSSTVATVVKELQKNSIIVACQLLCIQWNLTNQFGPESKVS